MVGVRSCETQSGSLIGINSPVNEYKLEDIAHSLSMLCRYNGQCKHFYSVATHSILVYELVKQHTNCKQTLSAALLHDATEAYLGDIITPIKNCMPEFESIERRMQLDIAAHFGIAISMVNWVLIKDADLAALKAEAAILMPSKGLDWGIVVEREYHINNFYISNPSIPMKWKDKFLGLLMNHLSGGFDIGYKFDKRWLR